MSPRHFGIRTLDHYAHWVDQTIQQRGGVLEHDTLEIEDIVVDDDELVGQIYSRQWFRLAHGFSVGFDKFIDVDLNVIEYHYEYRRTDGAMIVELHNHPGHEKDVGSGRHMHVWDGDDRKLALAPAYDFDEALDFFAMWPVR